MNDDIRSEEHLETPRRIFHTTVCGDTAEEIELAALDAAREFFGPAPRLQVVPDYQVCGVPDNSPHAETGKRYVAGVRVQTIEP